MSSRTVNFGEQSVSKSGFFVLAIFWLVITLIYAVITWMNNNFNNWAKSVTIIILLLWVLIIVSWKFQHRLNRTFIVILFNVAILVLYVLWGIYIDKQRTKNNRQDNRQDIKYHPLPQPTIYNPM